MKTDQLRVVLAQLTEALASGESHCGGGCGGCCDCTTIRSFEQSAARHNEASAFAAAESQKAFLQQQGAQFAMLLDQQQRHVKPPIK